MNNEKREALFIAGMYYVVIACVFAVLTFLLKGEFVRIMMTANTIFATCSLLLSDYYKRTDESIWILNILSIILLGPILIVLMIIDIIYNIIAFIYYLVKGGGEND